MRFARELSLSAAVASDIWRPPVTTGHMRISLAYTDLRRPSPFFFCDQNTSMTQKDDLRREARRHRDRIDPGSETAEEAARLFFQKIPLKPNQIVSAYWPKGREFPTFDILAGVIERGMTCALPVMRGESRVLSFAVWHDGDPLSEGSFGILQPPATEETQWVEPDILIVPLLAFDRRGHRLGSGMGYYDSTLAALRTKKPILAVGLAWAQQAVWFNLPAEPHDQPLDYVITPMQAHCFIP